MVYGRVNTDIRYLANAPGLFLRDAPPALFLSAFALSPPSVPPLIRDFTANFINANCKHIGQIEKRFRNVSRRIFLRTITIYYVQRYLFSTSFPKTRVYDEYFSIYFSSYFLSAACSTYSPINFTGRRIYDIYSSETVQSIARERESIKVFATELITVFHCKSMYWVTRWNFFTTPGESCVKVILRYFLWRFES